MPKPLKQLFKEYFRFSKSDRNGVIILLVLILLVIVANIIVSHIEIKSNYDYAGFQKMLDEWDKSQADTGKANKQFFSFNPNTILKDQLDSFNLPGIIKNNIIHYRDAGGKFKKPIDLRKIYGMNDSIYNAIREYIQITPEPKQVKKVKMKNQLTLSGTFNPNNADKKKLFKFGFNDYQASNILKYRAKGGVFKRKNDLLKIYGIDSAFFKIIKNNIYIEKIETHDAVVEKDPPQMVELNRADSIAFVKLKGIGPVFAARILKYRELLGGFYSKTQLLEVYHFNEETYHNIENLLTVDTTLINRIQINFADFVTLLKHPYLRKKDAQSILNYRDKNGSFPSLNILLDKNVIDTTTFQKIRPYLRCR